MPHQKQRLQNRVQRIDPIHHTPLSLTAFCLPQHGTCSPADAAGPAENPRYPRCSRGGDDPSGRICCGSSSPAPLPAKGSLPPHTQRLKYLSTEIISIPHLLLPSVTLESSCQTHEAERWVSVNPDSHSPCLCHQQGNRVRHF